jgi:putative ATPase
MNESQTRLSVPPPREPLAARMRPRTLDEVVGQAHLIGPGRLLRRSIEADRLGSMIFAGPPGTGKTTLARVIAGHTKATFVSMNAVLAGVKDIRDAVAEAEQRRATHGRRTVLFVDEVHRFNKAQQDALLPWVETGTVVLVGATTENPYFEVNKALVSRSRVFQLVPIDDDDLARVLDRAISDVEHGYGRLPVDLAADAKAHLVDVANGDARALLNALELAVETTPPGADGVIRVDLGVAEQSIQKRAVLYDRDGDAHFDTISAFIKSVRGSDPDAALYWLARMLHAGEDPRFVLRRLLILASEDVGLADPAAIGVVAACADAFDRMGMPEGRYPLAQATLYLSMTEKSNSTMGFFDALAVVEGARTGAVPPHLKDPSRDGPGLGHGVGYQYPHAWREHWVAQQYLPSMIKERVFYTPSASGWEGAARDRVARRREAQLAAMLEEGGAAEHLTTGPSDDTFDRWAARTSSGAGARAAARRDHLLAAVSLRRHDVVLDLLAGGGALTWELVRRVPEGGVYSVVPDAPAADALLALASKVDAIRRPTVVVANPDRVVAALGELRFEAIFGRDVLAADPRWLAAVAPLLQPSGVLVVLEPDVAQTQRVADLLDASALTDELRAAEATMWAAAARTSLPAVELERAGYLVVARSPVETSTTVRVTGAVLQRWFADRPDGWANRVLAHLSNVSRDTLYKHVRSMLVDKEVTWRSVDERWTARRTG